MEPLSWISPSNPLFPENSVHIWFSDLKQLYPYPESFEPLLSHDERDYFRGLPIPRVRNRQIITRGLLRFLLASYLDLAPSSLEFEKGKHGKPFLKPCGKTRTLNFNVTHSQDIALFAFSDLPDIGIDCEWSAGQRKRDLKGLAQRVFTQKECRELMCLPESDRENAFYRGWTRKEAFTKALGDGFQYGFQTFSVPLGADPKKPMILRNHKFNALPEYWRLHDIPLGEGGYACLCHMKTLPEPNLCFYKVNPSFLNLDHPGLII